MNETPRILFVGLGSPHGDDRIGWRVAEELLPHVADWQDVSVRTATVPLDLLDWIDGVEQLHLCDACRSDEPPGTVLRIEATPYQGRGTTQLPALKRLRSTGSHDFGLAAVLDLASRLGRLPRTVVVHAINGCRFEPGCEMSENLVAGIPIVIQTILKELAESRDVTPAVAAEPD